MTRTMSTCSRSRSLNSIGEGCSLLSRDRMRYWSRNSMDDQDVYSVIGEEGFRRLIAAFYRRVPTDDVLGPMYPRHDLAGAEQRLRDFLIFRFGGAQHYIEQRGSPGL